MSDDTSDAAAAGESLYNGMFAMDGVSGSPFWNRIPRAGGRRAFQGVETAAESAAPEAGAAWEALKVAAAPLQNIGSTAGEILRIRGRIPNLDPHVYGGDGPLSTTRTGTLFRFLDPLKSYAGGQFFAGTTTRIRKAPSGDDSGDKSAAGEQPDRSPRDDMAAGGPDVGRLALAALWNAGRVVESFTTPAIIAPPRALGPDVRVRRGFSIVMDTPPDDPLFTRDRRNDAVLALGRY